MHSSLPSSQLGRPSGLLKPAGAWGRPRLVHFAMPSGQPLRSESEPDVTADPVVESTSMVVARVASCAESSVCGGSLTVRVSGPRTS